MRLILVALVVTFCALPASAEDQQDAPKDMVLLALTFLVSAVTLSTGRTYMMQGAVHLVLFAAFLFLAFVP